MASNPGQIPAGGRDKISIVVKTESRGGGTIHKGFTVQTNDRFKARVRLEVAGEVKSYLTVSPRYIRLIGRVDQPLVQKVEITPMDGYSFKVVEIKTQKEGNLKYQVKPLDKGYEVLVENTRQEAGSYRDVITIKTDSKEMPSLTIPVYARLESGAETGKRKTD